MNRNSWSQLLLGRSSPDAVQRAAGRQWLRWWGCGSAAVLASIGIPLLVIGTYNYDQRLRDVGTPQIVTVTEVEANNAGSTFTFQVGGKDVSITNPEVAPQVGDEVEVVVDPDGRAVLADDVGSTDKAIGDAAFGVFIALIVLIGFGWGPGLAPYRALKAIRDPGIISQSAIVKIGPFERVTPPQGRLYQAWRRGTGNFYDVELVMPDKRVVRWCGRFGRVPGEGEKARLVGGGFAGDWVALVINVKGSEDELVCWPAAQVAEPAAT
ncbi:MAG: hypothetical protein ACT4P1_07095 [Sporichthyaceae bacterium]